MIRVRELTTLFESACTAILAESETRQWTSRERSKERVGLLIYFKVHPMFDELPIDPRLDALAKRIGIPE